MFKIIACINQKRVIGDKGKLLFHIKNDLSNFKLLTIGNVVVMGRHTYESLPNGEPLKNRINIILTTNKEYNIPKNDNIYIANSIQDVVELCNAFFSEKDLFVIGGGEIYKEFLEKKLVDEMILTIVNDETDGDTVFPEYNEDDWNTYFETLPQSDETHTFIYKLLKKSKNE